MRWEHLFATRTLRRLPGYPSATYHLLAHPMRARAADPSGPINQCGYDIVTIAFGEELELLALQARSFARFLDESFSGNILVIVNDLRCAGVARTIERRIVPHYGRWQKRVRIVPFHRLAHRLDPSNGWIIQQALKLASARMIDRPHYVVFDAKNHLIAPVGTANFFDEAGAARQAFQSEPTCMAQHHATGADYFGVDVDGAASQFVPMTPFVLHTRTTRDLIRHIETREQTDLSDFFCDTRFVSEFLLYGSFLARTPALLQRHYVDAPSQTVTVWKDSGSIADAVALAQDPAVVCFGMHREVLKRVDAAQTALLTAFWRERGLLRPDETVGALLFRRRGTAAERGIPASWLVAAVVAAAALSATAGGFEPLDLLVRGLCGVGAIAFLLAVATSEQPAASRLAGSVLAVIALVAIASVHPPPPDEDPAFGPPAQIAIFPFGRPPPPPMADVLDDLLDFTPAHR